MSMGGCILYLMPADRLYFDAKLEVAQQHALDEKLPLAAVTCVPPEQYVGSFMELKMLEMALAQKGIPLITLVGTEAATLPSLVKHTKPVHVYGQGDAPAGQASLQSHPYKWPGVVIKTEELKKIVDKNEYMC